MALAGKSVGRALTHREQKKVLRTLASIGNVTAARLAIASRSGQAVFDDSTSPGTWCLLAPPFVVVLY